jgi:beta-xylosidase
LPELLLQKFPAPAFRATGKMMLHPENNGDKAGLIIMGEDYAYIGVKKRNNGMLIQQGICKSANKKSPEIIQGKEIPESEVIYFKTAILDNAKCKFYYSLDRNEFIPFGSAFDAKPGRWIGAKTGIFCLGQEKTNDAGYVDIDWFRIEKL